MDPVNRRAVFIDVDGTLVNDRGLVPDSARLAVEQARANGHLVFLCTGRSTSELWAEIIDVGFDGIIAAAGGYIECRGQVVAHRCVPAEQVRRVVDYFDHHGIEYLLESNSGLYGSGHSRAWLRRLLFASVTDEDVLAELQRGLGGFIDSVVIGADPARDDINKIMFLDSTVPIETIRSEFADVFEVIPGTVPMLGRFSGEMSLTGVHKGAAIEALVEHLGMPIADTMAYGDGMNDLEMLALVDIGVAMGNARPEVKAVADDVTGTPDEDGIHTSFTKYALI
jgi:Cof subfamily protein (haloacid dehalogenase superfamily)